MLGGYLTYDVARVADRVVVAEFTAGVFLGNAPLVCVDYKSVSWNKREKRGHSGEMQCCYLLRSVSATSEMVMVNCVAFWAATRVSAESATKAVTECIVMFCGGML